MNALDRIKSLLVPMPNAQGIYVRNDDLAKLIALADAVLDNYRADFEPYLCDAVKALTQGDA